MQKGAEVREGGAKKAEGKRLEKGVRRRRRGRGVKRKESNVGEGRGREMCTK